MCTARVRRGKDMADGSVRWEIEENRFVVAHAKGVDTTVVCFMDTGGKWLTVMLYFCSGLLFFVLNLALM